MNPVNSLLLITYILVCSSLLLVWRLKASISFTSLQVKSIKSFLYSGNFTIFGVENAVGGVKKSSTSFDICCSFDIFSVAIEVLVFSLQKILIIY